MKIPAYKTVTVRAVAVSYVAVAAIGALFGVGVGDVYFEGQQFWGGVIGALLLCALYGLVFVWVMFKQNAVFSRMLDD